jgi:8-oxo-dGTP diphosphatase
MIAEGSHFIDVAAAIFRRGNLVLVARRAQGQHLEFKWEFPGGKIEENETPEECLRREMEEELGVIVEVGDFVGESIFNYSDKAIRLLAYYVELLVGNFLLRVHDKIDWVEIERLHAIDLASADVPISLILQGK